MATNQVIHGSNRVVENPNRYKLNAVSGQANTYDLEKVPGVITDNGTPYSKSVLDKIDNVLSYLVPTINQIAHSETFTISSTFVPNSISPSWTSTWTTLQNVTLNYGTFGDNYKLNAIFKGSLPFSSDTSSGYTALYSKAPNGFKYTSAQFLTNSKRTSYSSDYSNTMNIYGAGSQNCYIEFDFSTHAKPIFKYRIEQVRLSNAIIEASNDGINWTTLYNISNNIDQTYQSNDFYRYYRFYFEKEQEQVNGAASIYYLYVDEFDYQNITYDNEFMLDNNSNSFMDNQRLLIETPYYDKNGIISNLLNGISIPIILQPNTKYELIYNEDFNIFELGLLIEKKPLFDITLEENVSRVELNGLWNKLDKQKLYAIIINDTNLTGNMYIGTYTSAIVCEYDVNCFCALFSPVDEDDNWRINVISRAKTYLKSSGNPYEYLQVSSGNISAGTRIIIKEVA